MDQSVKTTPARRRRAFERLDRELGQLKADTGRNLYEMGIRLKRIRDERLYEGSKYRTFEQYLEKGVQFTRVTAYHLIRIATHFNAEIAGRYGFDKLRAALQYLAQAPEADRPNDPLKSPIRVRGPQGKYVTKTLHDATPHQIREAIVLLGEAAAPPREVPARLRARMGRLVKALPGAPRGTTRGRRVRLRRGTDGRIALTFQAIPLDQIEAFISALQDFADR